MTTLLFDIDGTLVRTGGAGKAAMEQALRTAFNVDHVLDVVPYSGRTDFAIAQDLLRVHNLPTTTENQVRLVEEYLSVLPHSLASIQGEVCPGIREMLPLLANREDVLLGLLTGNMRRGANTKLGHYGLWDYFTLGGFGDFYHERDDVARSAKQAVDTHLSRNVDASSIWVIGDTPLDVSCARAIGAKVVAVATGWHELDELKASKPEAALADLADIDSVLKLWGL